MLDFDPLKIFYCYSREDKKLRDRLAYHLEPLRRSKKIITWYDREISPGKDYEEEILSHLNTSDIILALISPAFISSNYCQQVEIRRALERHVIGDTRVVPVILKDVIWQDTSLGKLQALPEHGKPLVTWRPIDSGFVNIVAGIQRVIEEIKDNRTVIDPMLADRYQQKGNSLIDIDCYEEAVMAYKQSLRLNPNDFYTWWFFLHALVRLKKYKDILIVCEKLSCLSDRYKEIFSVDDQWEAVESIGPYIDIYEKKIEALKALNLLEEMKVAIKDLEFIKKDEEFLYEKWMKEKHRMDGSEVNSS